MNSPGVPDLLDKAERSLSAAEGLLADGFPDFAAARSYYAMFYATEALLLSRDQSFSKHSAFPNPSTVISLKPTTCATWETTELPMLSIMRLLPKPLRRQRPSVRPLETS